MLRASENKFLLHSKSNTTCITHYLIFYFIPSEQFNAFWRLITCTVYCSILHLASVQDLWVHMKIFSPACCLWWQPTCFVFGSVCTHRDRGNRNYASFLSTSKEHLTWINVKQITNKYNPISVVVFYKYIQPTLNFCQSLIKVKYQ